jgi:CRISPR/Cas system-associated exonuclease Cas4 (RecB family)
LIEEFYKSDIYVPTPELHYALLVTPPKMQRQRLRSLEFVFESNGRKVFIRGYMDIVFDEMVIEIKTGEAKDWHKIQALTYAVYENKPVRIVYVTQRYHMTVQPDREELARIVDLALDNEKHQYVNRNEHCAFCPLKSDCEA